MSRMKLDFDDGVALLKFNHPEVMNAVGSEMLADFREAVEEIKLNAGNVRCVLLTGEGRGFCAGANLSSGSERSNSGRQDAGHALETMYHPILRRLKNMNIPIVTAVNGAAAGIGMSVSYTHLTLPTKA